MKTLLSRARWWFLVSGIALLGYVALTLLDAALFQSYETWRFENVVNANVANPSPGPDVEKDRVILLAGTVIGRLHIARIGLNVMVVEGTDDKSLRRALGHVIGTALPGEPGNMAISGHRDTHFRPLRHLRLGDEIVMKDGTGSYRYQVESMRVVTPEDTEVLNGSSDRVLTLITCHPFNFVGSAPDRFIVRARQM